MHTLKKCLLAPITALCVGIGISSAADDRSEYNRRVSERFQSLFQSLDRNGDGGVTVAEAQGDLNFLPYFEDMDINRDGIVTAEELRRYLALNHDRP